MLLSTYICFFLILFFSLSTFKTYNSIFSYSGIDYLLLKKTLIIILEANLNPHSLCKSQVKQTVGKYFDKTKLDTSLTLAPCLVIKFERLSKIAKHPHVKSLSESEGTVRPPRESICRY